MFVLPVSSHYDHDGVSVLDVCFLALSTTSLLTFIFKIESLRPTICKIKITQGSSLFSPPDPYVGTNASMLFITRKQHGFNTYLSSE